MFSGIIGVPLLARATSALKVRHLISPQGMSAAGEDYSSVFWRRHARKVLGCQ